MTGAHMKTSSGRVSSDHCSGHAHTEAAVLSHLGKASLCLISVKVGVSTQLLYAPRVFDTQVFDICL